LYLDLAHARPAVSYRAFAQHPRLDGPPLSCTLVDVLPPLSGSFCCPASSRETPTLLPRPQTSLPRLFPENFHKRRGCCVFPVGLVFLPLWEPLSCCKKSDGVRDQAFSFLPTAVLLRFSSPSRFYLPAPLYYLSLLRFPVERLCDVFFGLRDLLVFPVISPFPSLVENPPHSILFLASKKSGVTLRLFSEFQWLARLSRAY